MLHFQGWSVVFFSHQSSSQSVTLDFEGNFIHLSAGLTMEMNGTCQGHCKSLRNFAHQRHLPLKGIIRLLWSTSLSPQTCNKMLWSVLEAWCDVSIRKKKCDFSGTWALGREEEQHPSCRLSEGTLGNLYVILAGIILVFISVCFALAKSNKMMWKL